MKALTIALAFVFVACKSIPDKTDFVGEWYQVKDHNVRIHIERSETGFTFQMYYPEVLTDTIFS